MFLCFVCDVLWVACFVVIWFVVCFVSDALCAVVWFVWCDVFTLACGC